MPINEAAGYRRSNLTKQQRFEQTAALYGYGQQPQHENMQNTFSQAQLEQMRAILQAHDSQSSGVIREFDLNNPPKLPYVYQEFPRLVYRAGKHRPTHNEAELTEALAHGWSKEPPVASQHEDEALDPQTAREVAAVEEKLAVLRKKK
jgi:hypothetical protein